MGSPSRLISAANQSDLLDFLMSAITILQNCPEASQGPDAVAQHAKTTAEIASIQCEHADPRETAAVSYPRLAGDVTASREACFSLLGSGKAPVTVLHETLQRFFCAVPGQEIWEWKFEPDTSGMWNAVVTIRLPGREPVHARSPFPRNARGAAKNAAALEALRELDAFVQESVTDTSSARLAELAQKFQRLYKANPQWAEEQNSKDRQLFRFEVGLPDSRCIQGQWARGKQQAKISALERFLEDPLTPSGTIEATTSSHPPDIHGESVSCQSSLCCGTSPTQFGKKPLFENTDALPPDLGAGHASTSSAPSSSAKLIELIQQFQQLYKQSPKWTEEFNAEDRQMFRFAVGLHNGHRVHGQWACGKQLAKISALEQFLQDDVTQSDSIEAPASSQAPVIHREPVFDQAALCHSPSPTRVTNKPFLQNTDNVLSSKLGSGRASMATPTDSFSAPGSESSTPSLLHATAYQGKQDCSPIPTQVSQESFAGENMASISCPTDAKEASNSTRISELTQKFHQLHKVSPQWKEEQSSEDHQVFRFEVGLPDGRRIQGQWARGKQKAKISALEQVLKLA
eukprot:TRINITY_DN31271_c0_g1_i1.p1 TRINITY_DN31271_c0_g1~~TRINITY_DN31271_c0_g1_i1.p1  ORF type:complete len:573 (+),score=78.31 TRINITY_DN31271_c0_g1_i1:314-2032(+)